MSVSSSSRVSLLKFDKTVTLVIVYKKFDKTVICTNLFLIVRPDKSQSSKILSKFLGIYGKFYCDLFMLRLDYIRTVYTILNQLHFTVAIKIILPLCNITLICMEFKSLICSMYSLIIVYSELGRHN